jgi:hypothetical protein
MKGFLLIFMLAGSVGLSSTPGLEVQHLRTSGTGQVAFDLLNASQQLVVAWAWEFSGTLPDGTKTGGAGSTDAYRLLDKPKISGQGPILPGESREEHTQVDPAARDIAVTITAVIYADGTAIGRSSDIDAIEQRRREEIEAFSVLLGLTENLKRSQDVKTDVRRILADLSAAEQAWSSGGRHQAHKTHFTNFVVEMTLRQQLRSLEQVSVGSRTEQAMIEQFEKFSRRELERSIRNAPKLRRQP